MSRLILLLAVVLPGVAVTLVCGWFLLQDWHALQAAMARFEAVEQTGDLRALAACDARQHIHRLNCFAEGVGGLLGWLIAAVGVHGLCVSGRRQT